MKNWIQKLILRSLFFKRQTKFQKFRKQIYKLAKKRLYIQFK